MFGIKTNLTDKLFSLLVRHRDNYTCARCGRKHERSDNTCDTSHYWGRGSKSVRWDFDNADTLCKLPCHSGTDSRDKRKFGWEFQKQINGVGGSDYDGEYTKFKKKQLGEARFNQLMIRAHTPAKVDEKLLRQGFKIELKRIENKVKSLILGAR